MIVPKRWRGRLRPPRGPWLLAAAITAAALPALLFLASFSSSLPGLTEEAADPVETVSQHRGLEPETVAPDGAVHLDGSTGPLPLPAEAQTAETESRKPDGATRRPEEAGDHAFPTDSDGAARATIREIARHDDPVAARALAEILFNSDYPEAVRIEAAHGLAAMSSREALEALLRATYAPIDSHPSEPVLHEVLRGLAGERFDEAGGFVERLLDHPEIDAVSKIAAIEAMATARGDDVLPVLLKYAANDDPDIREAAIWAITGHEKAHLLSNELMALLQRETAPLVRANLYEALRGQERIDFDPLWERVLRESLPPVRLAGINLLASHLPDEWRSRFDSTIVPELHRVARNDPSLSNRINAIVALGRADGSLESMAALHSLSQEASDPETRHAAELALRQ